MARPRPIAAAAPALLLALVVGCGRDTTYRTPDGEVKVNERDGQVTIKTTEGELKMDQKDGQATWEGTTKDGTFKMAAGDKGVALPDNFPKDVPIYKGATVQLAAAQGKEVTVHFLLPISLAEAAKFYSDGLKEQGWAIESTMNMEEMAMVSANKEKRTCAVVAQKNEKGSLVQVALSEKGS